MSAFLGPVHHRMYGKVQLLEALTSRLVALSIDEALAPGLSQIYGPACTKPLESIIDLTNIHGWLDNCVQQAESRYAAAVEALLEQNKGNPEKLAALCRSFGREHAVLDDSDAADAYQMIDSLLLDGMPCDGGRQVISADPDELVFQYDPGLHALCRKGQNGADVFATLREALLEGMLEKTGLQLTPLGLGTYRLSKEA